MEMNIGFTEIVPSFSESDAALCLMVHLAELSPSALKDKIILLIHASVLRLDGQP